MQPGAVIFDFDGVLFDTEPLHWRAFAEVLRPRGIELSWERYVSELIGYDDRDVFRCVLKESNRREGLLDDLIRAKRKVFATLVESEQPAPLPGAEQLIAECVRHEVPLAVCSGAACEDIQLFFQRWPVAQHFQVIVTADDVAASKPDPASYRLVLERLEEKLKTEVPPSAVVAIEDTSAGVEAAAGAGLRVLYVTGGKPVSSEASRVFRVNSLQQVKWEDLVNLVRAA